LCQFVLVGLDEALNAYVSDRVMRQVVERFIKLQFGRAYFGY